MSPMGVQHMIIGISYVQWTSTYHGWIVTISKLLWWHTCSWSWMTLMCICCPWLIIRMYLPRRKSPVKSGQVWGHTPEQRRDVATRCFSHKKASTSSFSSSWSHSKASTKSPGVHWLSYQNLSGVKSRPATSLGPVVVEAHGLYSKRAFIRGNTLHILWNTIRSNKIFSKQISKNHYFQKKFTTKKWTFNRTLRRLFQLQVVLPDPEMSEGGVNVTGVTSDGETVASVGISVSSLQFP